MFGRWSFKPCSGSIPVVEVEQSTKTLTSLHRPIASYDVGVLGFDEAVPEPLVRSLAVIVLYVLRDRVTEVILAERDDAAEALGFIGEHEALGVRVQIRGPCRQPHDLAAAVLQQLPERCRVQRVPARTSRILRQISDSSTN